jgi:hypothetical protein
MGQSVRDLDPEIKNYSTNSLLENAINVDGVHALWFVALQETRLQEKKGVENLKHSARLHP